MKLRWLFLRIVFILKQIPKRIWRLLTFFQNPFYKIYTPSVRLSAVGLLLADLLFIFDFFEIITNLISPNSRLLTPIEKKRIQKAFGESLDSELVMWDKRSIPVRRGMAHAFVTFNTVNSFRPVRFDIFIHEMTHIWQYQNFGAGYIAAALAAQRTEAGYNYSHTEGWHEQSFFDLNAEQQADFIKDLYLKKEGYRPEWAFQKLQSMPKEFMQGDEGIA